MTGTQSRTGRSLRILIAGAAVLGLAGCDGDGKFAFPSAGGDPDTPVSVQSGEVRVTDQDVERPDIFEVTDRGLWDGRPSLGGVWVAHPDATDPERVIIRNSENGKTIVGALFRRERENPGPLLQVSSDAAEKLGILPGAPTSMSVIALRREEVEVEPEPAENPVVADLAAPVSVAATPLDPIAGAAAAITAAEAAATAPVALPAASPAPVVAAVEPAPVVPVAGSIQLGVFSVERNANAAAQKLRDDDIATSVIAEQAGGRTVWRVVANAAGTEAENGARLARIKALGFVDAFPLGG